MINKYPYTDFNEYNMDWIIKTVKDLTVQWAETHQEWQDVQTEWTNYKNYIDTYFENLDLSQEVSDKINQMAADGYFSDLFNTLFRSDIITKAGQVTSDWIADNLIQETGYVIDASLTVANAAADAKAAGDRINEIKSDFNYRVPEGYNLIDLDAIIDDTYIINSTGGTGTNVNYKATDFIPLAGDKFVLGAATNLATVGFYGAWYDANKDYISAVTLGSHVYNEYFGSNYGFWVVTVPSTAKYIRISFSNVFWARGPLMYDGDIIRTLHQSYAPSNILIPEKQDSRYGAALNEAVGGFYTNSYNSKSLIYTTPYIMGVKNSSHGGETLAFFGEFSAFNGAVEFSFKDEDYVFGIDSDEYYFKTGGSESRYNHSLTLQDYLAVTLQLDDNGYTCKIDVSTNGGSLSITNNTFISRVLGQPTIKSISPQNFTFSFASWLPKTSKPIWLFGDSYLSAWSNARWPYYLYENDQGKNIMLDGFPGEAAQTSIISFENLLKLGTPRYAIWTVGMNNGDGTDINADWKTATDHFIELCEEKNIIPVLATIPNVPSVLHTYKNDYIRDSGYRYIDFAKALNANTSGSTWYPGMLAPAPDLVHPTPAGAKCMYDAFIAAFPEILFK